MMEENIEVGKEMRMRKKEDGGTGHISMSRKHSAFVGVCSLQALNAA